MEDEHHYLVMQIRALLDKHLETDIRNNGLWRIQILIDDELEAKENLINNN